MLDVFLHFYIRPLRDFFSFSFLYNGPSVEDFLLRILQESVQPWYTSCTSLLSGLLLPKKKHKILSSLLLTLMAKIHAAYGTCLILLFGRTCDVDGPWHTCGNNEPLLGTAQLIKIWASLFYPFFYCIIRRRELPVALHFTLTPPHLRKNKILSLSLLFL